jgi:hypothetical protein
VITLIKAVLGGAALLMLSACAGTYNAYIDTLKLAFNPGDDVSLTLAEVQAAPSDLLYVRHGERSQAAMALLKVEAGQHKWLSADQALLVMEQGRIVKTLGFSNDLLYLSNTRADMIRDIERIGADSRWPRQADWQNGEYGYQLQSQFQRQADTTLSFFQHQLDSILIVETVQYSNASNYLRIDRNWHNYFWFDKATGSLIKSRQQLAPFAEPIEMIYISRIARSVPASKGAEHE